MEYFSQHLAAKEENLKNACATPQNNNIFVRIHADGNSDLTDQNTTSNINLFWTNNLGKGMDPLIPPSNWLNSITTVLLQKWHWY